MDGRVLEVVVAIAFITVAFFWFSGRIRTNTEAAKTSVAEAGVRFWGERLELALSKDGSSFIPQEGSDGRPDWFSFLIDTEMAEESEDPSWMDPWGNPYRFCPSDGYSAPFLWSGGPAKSEWATQNNCSELLEDSSKVPHLIYYMFHISS